MGKKVFSNGQANLEGEVINHLKVGSIAARSPQVRWQIQCDICGARTTELHSRLINGAAQCKASGCGRADVREAAALTPAALRRKHDELAAADRKNKEQADAKRIADAEAKAIQTQRELAKVLRERVTTRPDDEVYVSPELATKTMSETDADSFNAGEGNAFFASPEYAPYRTPDNLAVLGDYFHRNHLGIIDRAMVQAAFLRLRDAGLLAPAAAPEPPPKQPLETPRAAPRTPVAASPELPIGIDPDTGKSRSYTPYEVNRMTAEEYRRAFQLRPSEMILANRL